MYGHEKGPVFEAYVLESDPEHDSSTLISRPHLERMLDYRPWLGRNIVLAGPAGTGKTTVALQAATNQAPLVQYITARGVPPALPIRVVSIGDNSRGQHMADLLNALSAPYLDTTFETVERIFQQMEGDSRDITPVLVVDDLDLIPRDTLQQLVERGIRPVPWRTEASTIFIMRRSSDQAHEWISPLGKSRVIEPHRFMLLEDELDALVAQNSMGTATHAEIRQAYAQVGGWFAGIQRMVDSAVMRESSFDEYVLEELVLTQPRRNQNLFFALAAFPFFSTEIAAHLLNMQCDVPESDPAVLNLLPLQIEPETQLDRLHARMPQPLRASFDRLIRRHGDWETIQSLRRGGIDWFIAGGDFASAKDLAVASSLSSHYLSRIHDHCFNLAMQEDWLQIRDLVSDTPMSDLLSNHDIVFWLILADMYDGNWTDVERMQMAAEHEWGTSSDPLLRGRGRLLEAWKAWRTSDDPATQYHAAESFDLLPIDALQERMFAAVTTEVAARHNGDSAAIDLWTATSAECRATLSSGPEWWHNHCGFHRQSYLAMSGDIDSAFRLATLAYDNVDPDHPRAGFRFLLIMAHIEIERGHLTIARRILDRAERHVNGSVPRNMLDLTLAHYYLALGDPEQARGMLGVKGLTVHNRPDRNSHRLRLIAQIEMSEGRIDLAHDILSNWTHGEDQWPKYFGESQHFLLKATLEILRGRAASALDMTQRVIEESRRRGHSAYELAAHAVQAEIFQRNGDATSRDASLATIAAIDPARDFLQSCMPLGRDVRLLQGTVVQTSAPPPDLREALQILTAREKELLDVAAEGLSTRRIAERLFISESTVRNHLSAAYKKLGVRSRKEAIMVTHPLRRKD